MPTPKVNTITKTELRRLLLKRPHSITELRLILKISTSSIYRYLRLMDTKKLAREGMARPTKYFLMKK